jgi:hypothetical protein
MEARETLRLPPSRTKTLFLLAVSLAFTAIGAAMILSGGGIANWFCGVFFGVCSTAFTIQLWPGASYLLLLPDGFVVCLLFRRRPLIRWDSVSEFRVALVPASGMRMVVFSRDPSPNPRLASINRRLVGDTDGLPDSYGRKPDQLADVLNEWRRRAIS